MKTYYEQVTEKLDYKNTLFKYIDSHPERPIYLCIDDQFKALDKYLNKNDLAFLMQSLLFKYIFYKAGEKIFTFSPDLLKLLSHTSLEKINTETLQLPFESIFFHDLSSLNMRLEEKEYYLQSAFIMRIPALKIAPVLDLWEELDIPIEENPEVLGIFLVPNTFLPDGEIKDAWPFMVPIARGNIYDYIDLILERWKRRKWLDDEKIEFFKRIFAILFNCVLYINSSGASQTLIKPERKDLSKIKNPKKKRREERNTTLPYYVMGKDIIINRQDRESFNRSEHDPVERHTLSWLVRGHWRNQPIGEGRKETKLIWIKPFRKGSEMAELIDKKYKVK